jgi:predicted O-methyltransferase YrrM
MSDYDFTNQWFQSVKPVWDNLLLKIKPKRILEIGSYEGASACYLTEKIGAERELELNCIDNWLGGIEHQAGGMAPSNMSDVEKRFHKNIALAKSKTKYPVSIIVRKNTSDVELARLLAEGKSNYFDLIYIDGSHQAADVLYDAVVSFKLLSIDGILIFDDYLWAEKLPSGKDILRCPKMAIDAFVNINFRKLRPIAAPSTQFYLIKTAH